MAAFRILAEPDRRRPAGRGRRRAADPRRALAEISPWFVPATCGRGTGGGRARAFGSGAPVVVRSGRDRRRQAPRPRPSASTRPAWPEIAPGASARPRSGSRSCSATTAGPVERERPASSSRPSPGTCAATASRTSPCSRRRPCTATPSRTARSQRSPSTSASTRRVPDRRHQSTDLRPFVFERGFVQHAISGTWLDADLRIVMPKLRTDPTEFAHLSLSTLEGSTGAIDETLLRRTQRRLPVGDHDAARRGAARLRRRRRLGAGRRRAVRGHGMPPPGRRSVTSTRGPTCSPSTRWSSPTSGSTTPAGRRSCDEPTTGSGSGSRTARSSTGCARAARGAARGAPVLAAAWPRHRSRTRSTCT